MSKEIKNKFIHLASLIRNPYADSNNIASLKKELEWVNTTNWTQADWQLYHQVFN